MKRAAGLLFRQETGIWLLLMLALACLPWALRREVPDAALTLLAPAVLIAASGAFILSGLQHAKSPLAGVFAAGGALLLFIRIGQLGEAIGAALLATARMGAIFLLPSQQVSGQLAATGSSLSAQAQAWTDLAAFAQRSGSWLAAILQGQVLDDPSSRAVVLALALWLLAFWAGRRLRLHDDPLGALLPVTASLAFTLDRTVQDRWPLWLHLAALLCLLGTMHISRLLVSWRSTHTDYSDSIPEESLLSGLVLSLLVLSTAFAVSTFSLDDFLDRFRRPEPATASSTASSSRHTAASGVARSSGSAGLQTAHLVSAGPSLSQDVVMYVRTGDLPPMPPTVTIDPRRYYWRVQTYQRYNGRAWSNLNWTDVRLEPETQLIEVSPLGFRKVHASVEIPAGLSGAAYWTGVLVGTDMPLDVAWHLGSGSNPADPFINTPHNVDLIGARLVEDEAHTLDAYSFDALVPDVTEEQLRQAPATYPDWITRQYLQLPDMVPDRVRGLARDITARGRTPYDRAVAIERYLRLIPYSLDVPAPPSPREATDFFLFDLKRGYCDYYATAMTVMARAAGLPARLVTGYASGGYDSYSAEYVVREADSHSWTEIYFTGIGWIEFEPTAGQPSPHRETMQPAPVPDGATPAIKRGWQILPSLHLGALKSTWLLIPLVTGLYGCWLFIDDWRLRWMSPDRAVGLIYRRLHHATRTIARSHSAAETVREHTARITSWLAPSTATGRVWRSLAEPAMASIISLADLRMRSLFSPAPLTRAEAREAVAIWSALRWRLTLLGIWISLSGFRRRAVPSGTRGHAAE